MIGEAGKSVRFVINRAPSRSRVADLIRAKIKETNLPVARSELGNRTIFAESLAKGQGVVEMAPSSAASIEINSIVDEVFSIAGDLRSVA